MTSNTRLMILGAGVYQVPLIRKARDMGLETIVVSRTGNYPGLSLADVFVAVDTTDTDQVVAAARDHAISGVTTTGTDVCIASLGAVVDALGLPGTGHEAALRSMDKVLMKRALLMSDVPTAVSRAFTDPRPAQLFADQLGYPVMVKAPDSSGSRGITKVCSEKAFHSAWNRALEAARSKLVIVEEFLDGIEFGAQAFVHGDQVAAVFPHRDTVTSPPFVTPIGHSIPMILSRTQREDIESVVERGVRALGMRDCVSNVDLMLVNGQPKIIEIGARMGATCLPETVSVYAGIDAYEHLIRLALGEHPELKVAGEQANASLLLRSSMAGLVTSLAVPPEVQNHPGLIDLHWDVAVGDRVREFMAGPDRIGHMIVKSNTAEEGERLVRQLASLLHIEIDNRKLLIA